MQLEKRAQFLQSVLSVLENTTLWTRPLIISSFKNDTYMWTHQNVREIGTKPRFRRGLFEGRGLRFWHIQEEFHAMFNFWKLEIYIEMRSNNCLENWTSYIILLCEKCDWILCWYDINLIQPTKPNAHRVWINKALLRNKLIKLLQSCKFFPAIVNCGVWSGGGNAKRGICGECRGSISSERPPDRAFPVPGSVQLQHPIGGFKYPFRLVDGNPFHHFRLCWKLLKYWKMKQFPCKQTEVAKPASWNLDEKDSSAWLTFLAASCSQFYCCARQLAESKVFW